MIELPRAAMIADKIAEIADFFSFGTNDLTQTVFGLSRDDAGKFLPRTLRQGSCRRILSSRSTWMASARWFASRRKKAGKPRSVEAWHLWRAWRRPRLDRVLRAGWAGLRIMQPVSRAGRPPRGGPSGARRRGRPDGITGAGAVVVAFVKAAASPTPARILLRRCTPRPPSQAGS